MSSLREIKDRIGSVKGTLKITSAMKLVASSKLRKAQKAIEAMRPYETALGEILSSLPAGGDIPHAASADPKVAIVAIASNSSLCGAFNANAVKKAKEAADSAGSGVVVYSIGRKMAEAMKRLGHVSPGDFTSLCGSSDYAAVCSLATDLCKRYSAGEYSKVLLVYNHFVSTSRQDAVTEQYLPAQAGQGKSGESGEEDYICEPSGEEIAASLLPQVLGLKLFAAVLDSAAAEHAARTIAMQTASDNAEDLLSALTLEYNKGRQQKITAEILDLLGGSAR